QAFHPCQGHYSFFCRLAERETLAVPAACAEIFIKKSPKAALSGQFHPLPYGQTKYCHLQEACHAGSVPKNRRTDLDWRRGGCHSGSYRPHAGPLRNRGAAVCAGLAKRVDCGTGEKRGRSGNSCLRLASVPQGLRRLALGIAVIPKPTGESS